MNDLIKLNLESMVFIKVRDYDVYLDEIKTWSPMLSFRPVKLKYIINMLNRNLIVDFKEKQDELDTFLFIKQYNAVAREENEKAKSVIYQIPDVAENVLTSRLKLQSTQEKNLQNKINPNPFIVVERPLSPVNPGKKSVMKSNKSVVVKRKKIYELLEQNMGEQQLMLPSDNDNVELTY